jgi:hypothetical protein
MWNAQDGESEFSSGEIEEHVDQSGKKHTATTEMTLMAKHAARLQGARRSLLPIRLSAPPAVVLAGC